MGVGPAGRPRGRRAGPATGGLPGPAAVALLVGLSTLTVAAAGMLGDRLWSTTGWLLILGLLLFAAGALAGYLAWRRFRHTFTGMEQTMEELREDLVWLAEKAGRSDVEPQSDAPADD